MSENNSHYSSSLKRVNQYLTLTHGDIDIDKVFNITIRPWSEEVRLEKVLESINLDYCVTSNLDLKTRYDYDVSASWTSSRSDVIDEKGKVNFKDTEIDVILKVKLKNQKIKKLLPKPVKKEMK